MWDATGTRWHFDSGSLALDFGYTGDWGYGVPDWERLHSPADLESWLVERIGPLAEDVTDKHLRTARRLRGSVTALAIAAADGTRANPDDVDRINRAAAASPVRPHLPGGSTTPEPPRLTAAMSTIAENAVDVLSRGDARIRRCAGERCELVFFDGSPPNRRRWCSMRRCGNRTKVHRHRSPER